MIDKKALRERMAEFDDDSIEEAVQTLLDSAAVLSVQVGLDLGEFLLEAAEHWAAANGHTLGELDVQIGTSSTPKPN